MAFDVHDCIAFLTNSGGKSLDESMNRRFRGQDITRTQWTALYYIDRIPDITQKELAEAMMISGPSASNLVDRLETAGLLCTLPPADSWGAVFPHREIRAPVFPKKLGFMASKR